ncbi:uncharacterized protein LOC113306282 [Papaver somniferum]|uniref:uncharacterized protein LOC113306282 n=1 Tax=Papaver somniferum TaxID=3469 RepID=UPI000E6FE5B9|nr:uncharacterized protein LOC113306282 [Papaver somniferum]
MHDGASRGNPGVTGYGFVCRGDQGEFMYAESKGIGIATNFIAEVMTIIGAAEWALQNNKLNICINSNSKAAVSEYISDDNAEYIPDENAEVEEALLGPINNNATTSAATME